jgi:hypothetical protein
LSILNIGQVKSDAGLIGCEWSSGGVHSKLLNRFQKQSCQYLLWLGVRCNMQQKDSAAFFFFETGSCYVAKAGLKLEIHLPLPPKC